MDVSDIAAHVVVMAKPVVAGRVKTRLIGKLRPHAAARVHAAMLECVLERAGLHVANGRRLNYFLALDHSILPSRGAAAEQRTGIHVPTGWRVIDQGAGDLGQRLRHVWRAVGGHTVVFFGGDSPDVPAEVLGSILPALERTDVALGPVDDGGYWTLAAREFEPRLLTGIDWGTPSVYHQTLVAAREAGLSMGGLARWYDVDQPADLTALRQRIDRTPDPALVRLRLKLDRVLTADD